MWCLESKGLDVGSQKFGSSQWSNIRAVTMSYWVTKGSTLEGVDWINLDQLGGWKLNEHPIFEITDAGVFHVKMVPRLVQVWLDASKKLPFLGSPPSTSKGLFTAQPSVPAKKLENGKWPWSFWQDARFSGLFDRHTFCNFLVHRLNGLQEL